MKLRALKFFSTGASLGLSLIVMAAFSGCNRDEVKVYRVEKEKPAAHSDHAGHSDELPDGHPGSGGAQPKLSWTLPAGWTESSRGQMSLASFSVTGKDGQRAQVSVTPLGGMAGKEALIVNMWRQQVGLNQLSEAEAMKQLTDVDIGGQPGKMFDIAGKSETGEPMRIVTAMVHRGSRSWFYKLQGDDQLVQAEKPAFVTFLKSFKIEEAEAPAGLPDGHPPIAGNPPTQTAPPATTSGAGGSNWAAPAAWKSVAPGMMQAAKFSVPEVGGAKADVAISIFPTSTGGTLANVNRWRNQIALGPIEESGLAAIVKPLDDKRPEAMLTDMSNGSRRLVGAIVPSGGQWYFFKLLGDDAAVASQKEAFIKFVKESKY